MKKVAAILTISGILLLITISLSPSVSGAQQEQQQQDQSAARKEYSDKTSSTYNFRFGKDKPFIPGNAKIEGDEFVQPGAFPNASYCGHCHQEAYHQWRQALHSNAFRTPFYRTSVNILIRTK
jgi:hypothetical protein